MIRSQRRLHAVIWVLMAPLLALVLALALLERPAEPVVDSLPPVLEGE